MGSWLCPDTYAGLVGDPTGVLHAQAMANIIGVTANDYTNPNVFTGLACAAPLALQAGTFGSRDNVFMNEAARISKSQVDGNLYHGNEASLRLDWNASNNDRLFTEFKWLRSSDEFGPQHAAGARGFVNPTKVTAPHFSLNWVHTFSPTFLNEFHAGYTGNIFLNNGSSPATNRASIKAVFDCMFEFASVTQSSALRTTCPTFNPQSHST